MPEITSYKLTMINGSTQRLTIPATWRLSFGPNFPPTRRGYGVVPRQDGWCLRAYTTSDRKHLKLCIPDVLQFIDETAVALVNIQEAPIPEAQQRSHFHRLPSRVTNTRSPSPSVNMVPTLGDEEDSEITY
jgi:hypothetical protein